MPTDSTIPEAVTFPPNPPIGLSQQSLWTNFTQVCQELVQKNNRIKYLEEQVVNVGSALVHLQEDIKSQRKTVTFTIIKDVKEAYKVLGIEEKVSDDRLVDLLQVSYDSSCHSVRRLKKVSVIDPELTSSIELRIEDKVSIRIWSITTRQ